MEKVQSPYLTLRLKMPRSLKFKVLPAVLLLSLFCGCVNRSLSIQTPESVPACEVFIDGVYAGKTPYTTDFVFYGTREIKLRESDGGITILDVPIKRPWYQYFPLDLFSELLYPGNIDHPIVVTLMPLPKKAPDLQAIRKRADEFRAEYRNNKNGAQ